MKITEVVAVPVGIPLDERLRWGAMSVGTKGGVIVVVSTDEGHVGIGEAGFSSEYFPTVGPIVNDQLAPMIVGSDPRDLTALWERMYSATHIWGRRGIETYALSGIDIALWDLMGKIADLPLYQLLGAARRSSPAYFAPSWKGTDAIVSEVCAAADDGYAAAKLRIGPDVTQAIGLVTAVREAVGDDFDLMVDANMAYDRWTAARVARELEELGVAWFEEPILCHSLTQYVEEHVWLRDQTTLRLAGGESLFTRYEYPELIDRRVFDVLQPDCAGVGGISEAKRVADMASASNITCVPHIACSSGTTVGLAAGLHLVLSCANAPLVEYDPYGGPGWDGFVVDPIEVVAGQLHAPDRPGLGIELAPDAFQRFGLAPISPAVAEALRAAT